MIIDCQLQPLLRDPDPNLITDPLPSSLLNPTPFPPTPTPKPPGAWALVTPANFASYAGIVGVCSYAVATGIPILLIAFAGNRITQGMPHVFSLSDFVGWRFGPIAKTIVAIIAVFNMCIVLLAEYTTIGSIFGDFVGGASWGIILAVALVTMAYTSYGGLVVSIATDQVQGIASALLMVVVSAYIGSVHKCVDGWLGVGLGWVGFEEGGWLVQRRSHHSSTPSP